LRPAFRFQHSKLIFEHALFSVLFCVRASDHPILIGEQLILNKTHCLPPSCVCDYIRASDSQRALRGSVELPDNAPTPWFRAGERYFSGIQQNTKSQKSYL
jgi:hypothetical protein